jgi:hypothetical protein
MRATLLAHRVLGLPRNSVASEAKRTLSYAEQPDLSGHAEAQRIWLTQNSKLNVLPQKRYFVA